LPISTRCPECKSRYLDDPESDEEDEDDEGDEGDEDEEEKMPAEDPLRNLPELMLVPRHLWAAPLDPVPASMAEVEYEEKKEEDREEKMVEEEEEQQVGPG
jgi:hypothetical protein